MWYIRFAWRFGVWYKKKKKKKNNKQNERRVMKKCAMIKLHHHGTRWWCIKFQALFVPCSMIFSKALGRGWRLVSSQWVEKLKSKNYYFIIGLDIAQAIYHTFLDSQIRVIPWRSCDWSWTWLRRCIQVGGLDGHHFSPVAAKYKVN